MSKEEIVGYNGITLLDGVRHIYELHMDGKADLLQIYFSRTGRSIRVFKNGRELK